MEPNNQSPQPVNSSVPGTPTPPPVAVPVFNLAAFATPPLVDTSEHTPVPMMSVPIAPTPLPPQLSLSEQVAQIEKDIILLDQKRESLEVETGTLTSEQKKIEESLAPVVKEEKDVRALLKEIESREMSAVAKADKRKAEQERFEQEKKRRTVEVTKLEIKEKIEKILSSISEKEVLHQSIIDEEIALKKKIHELEMEQKRIELNVKLQLITQTRGDAELALADITKEKTRIQTLLRETEVKEKTIEEHDHDLEQKLSVTQTLKEERALAEARTVLEKERHDIELARWDAEDQADELGHSSADAEKVLKEIKKQEAELILKLKAFQ